MKVHFCGGLLTLVTMFGPQEFKYGPNQKRHYGQACQGVYYYILTHQMLRIGQEVTEIWCKNANFLFSNFLSFRQNSHLPYELAIALHPCYLSTHQ